MYISVHTLTHIHMRGGGDGGEHIKRSVPKSGEGPNEEKGESGIRVSVPITTRQCFR
jgi:hypothetical protein